MKTSPLQAVKERFGDKAKLVSAVQALATDDLWLSRVNEVKGLERVSNAKLLRLHDTLSRVKKDFGSRGKLIDSILTLGKRQKDTGLKTRLEGLPTPRLVDLQTSAARRAKATEKTKPAAAAKAGAGAAAKKKATKKKARSKKAKAKAREGGPAKKKATKKKA
jgi:hypothetical protein